MSIESDVFPMTNCIEHLIALHKPVVGIAYFHFQKEKTRILNSKIETINSIDFCEFLTPIQAINYFNGNVNKAFHCGIGCMLIHKNILKLIKIRLGDEKSNELGLGSPPDYFIHSDLNALGVPVYIDTRLIATHYNNRDNWDKIKKITEL